MLFHTLDFLIFFALVLIAFRAIPARFRFTLLLAASLFFYGYWNYRVLALLVVTVGVNYVLARLQEDRAEFRRVLLGIAILVNLSFLGVFKYANFFIDSLKAAAGSFGLPLEWSTLDILLPAGISFYTFELISYNVDVFRGAPAERSFGRLLLFGTYFPKMMAGPIARAGDLIPQLVKPAPVDASALRSGSFLFFLGMAKKVAIADNLGIAVNRIVGNTHAPSTLAEVGLHANPGWVGIAFAGLLFAMQIYADFSGYSDMARGMSRMFGIELPENFSHPFLSPNPAEFWRRWHITLGAFLRDYLYIPLGGSRVSTLFQLRNVMIVWTLGGLWHGASAGYLSWGVYCGLCLAFYIVCQPLGRFVPAMAARLITFILFAFGLMIFRVGSVPELLRLLGSAGPIPDFWPAFFILPLVSGHVIAHRGGNLEQFVARSSFHLAVAANLILYAIVFLGVFQGEEFFYFQF